MILAHTNALVDTCEVKWHNYRCQYQRQRHVMSSCMDIELNKELDVDLIFVCEIDYEVKTFPRANEAHGLYIENHSLKLLFVVSRP